LSAPDMSKIMATFFRLLAEEVEHNHAMAKRLSAPLEEFLKQEMETVKPRRKKNQGAELPQDFDPFRIYHDQGSVGLYAALQIFDAGQCKTILSKFALDPGRTYVRWRKQERLAGFIVERVKAVSEKGMVFMD